MVLAGLMHLSTSCNLVEVDPVTDPNSPSSAAVLENATLGQLQDLAAGLESVHRNYNSATSGWWSLTGTISRELYYINTSDPSFAGTWLQIPPVSVPAEQDNNFFVDGSGYNTPYFAIRHANLVIESVNNTDVVTEAQRNGYLGFANTIKAYQFQMPLMHQYENGIRVDVTFQEPLNPGGYLSYDDALSEIRGILDQGYSNLQNAGNEFAFTLSQGFEGFNTPSGMMEVNRAIAARYAIYAEDWQGALTALDDSFLNLTPGQGEAELYAGPQHTFSGGNDLFNPYHFVPDADQNLLIVPSPAFVDEADNGDLRLERKLEERENPATTPDITGLESAYQDARFSSATSPMPFIRNEELLLIYAEANIQIGDAASLDNAVDALNIIREAWGVGAYTGTINQEALIDEMLKQRRYSLWGEGHRWVDMRRYERLDQIDTSADGGRVANYIGRPQGELDWDTFSSN